MMKKHIFLIAAAAIAISCSPSVRNASHEDALPVIYPDYTGVTIPTSIAPLNFNLEAEALDVTITGADGKTLRSKGRSSTSFARKGWLKMLERNVGDSIYVAVSGLYGKSWKTYKPFGIFVSPDPIDYGLDYRLIEPGYEVYSLMGIYERELSSFKQKALLENTQFDGCVNCHSYNHNDPSALSLHIRGDHGATLIQRGGELEAYNTKTDNTLGFCVYPYWHPSGNYIAYSTNSTRQGFHVQQDKLIEVFDNASDVQIYDVVNNVIITSPELKQEGVWESFPVFSPDGLTLYFCSAREVEIPGELPSSRYSLVKTSFDPTTGTIGKQIDTLINADIIGQTVIFPKPSYDGKYIMYTRCDYGTFPIWHHESDLWLLDLETGENRPLDEVNSDDTESYHNWSSNSRWFVFVSRRDNGLFTHAYIAHFDENGVAGKPFMLPQKDPRHYYDTQFRSYNVPEFVTGPVKLNKRNAQKKINSPERVPFGFRWSD